MKVCLTLMTFVTAAYGASLSYLVAPTLRSYPYVYGRQATSVITPVQHQYHTQDELGQYAYGYSDPLSTKQEVRSLDGVTRGSYSYRDAEGILQTVDYTADDTGFHVAATNLPKPVQAMAFRSTEPTISDTVSSVASNSISSDTDSESIASAGAIGDEIYSRSGLRMAEPSATHTKHIPTTAHVRSVELRPTLENTIQVASASGLYLRTQPRKMLTNAPVTVAVAEIQVPKDFTTKIYGLGYPLGKHYFYY